MKLASMLSALTLCGALIATGSAMAEIQTKEIDYQDGDVPLQGYLAWDDAADGPRPGVIVVHEWWGLNDYVRERAEQLAGLGYVAFAIDMYGKDKMTDHPEQAGEWSKQIQSNVEQWRQRALKGLEILRDQEQVDPEHLAAIGYCFGGATVMQMAYSGADLDGVVSFHGSLPTPGEDSEIKASILAAHGNQDGFVPPEKVDAFQTALTDAGADWQMVVFSNARHGFTNPNAGDYGIDNLKYDEQADKLSWQYMQAFFDRIFNTD